jgi:DNA-binding MarR family transcriptional regulator
MPSDTQLITDIGALLVPFTVLDPSIQVTTALGFLFVAQHHDRPGGPTTRAMARELNLTSTSASRITYYWADKGYLSVSIDPADKRRRIVSLTPKS